MFKSIVVPIDIAHRSSWEVALPQAIKLAQSDGGMVTAITVVRDIGTMFEGAYFAFQIEQLMEKAREQLADIVSKYSPDEIQIEEEVRFGSICREILDAADDRKADLIVMASHRPVTRSYPIGKNAAQVAQLAECSVLVLRGTT
jgi:nucleotide-binding universal stress UspA family protein